VRTERVFCTTTRESIAIEDVVEGLRRTKIIGERFYIYASRKWAGINGHPPNGDGVREGEAPTGVIVGTAVISDCQREMGGGHYCWHLADVKRIERPRKPKRQPQPVWFRPF
jgi:hypothetical protein